MTIPISVANKEVTARLWMGRTQVVEPNATRTDVDAIAIYLPDSKLLWWTLNYANASFKPWPIDEWKKRIHCGATGTALVCFWASQGLIRARQVSAKTEGSDVAGAVGQMIAKLNADSVRHELLSAFEMIEIADIKELRPFYTGPGNVSASWRPDYFVTNVVPMQGRWEVYIQESGFGQVAAVRLDSSLHPISGRMIKSHQ
jgi:hypothetical protein